MSEGDHRDYAMRAFRDALQQHDVEKGELLDVGCRDTCLKPALEALGFHWTGVDPHAEDQMVRYGLMEQLQFPDDYFSVVFVCHSFEHCERPVDALREFHRVLKKDGFLFIAGPPPTTHHILEADDDHIFVLDERQLLRLLRYTGFVDGETWRAPGHNPDTETVCAGVFK